MAFVIPLKVPAGLCILFFVLGCATGCMPPAQEREILVTVSDEGGGEARNHVQREEIEKLARLEGELFLYTSVPQRQARDFADTFEAKYNFIKVRLVREGTFDIVNLVQREISQGQPRADVLHVLDPAIFIALRQRGELNYFQPSGASMVAPQYRGDGYWQGARLVTVCMAYDTRRLSPDEAPATWTDILDERWHGRIGIKDAQTGGSAYAHYYLLREKYGVSYWERLAKLRPRIYKSGEELLQALLDGEIDIATGVMGYQAHEYVLERKEPIAIVWPRDGVPLVVGPVAILRRAPNINAARLFVEYAMSAEGQAALRDIMGSYSTRSDIDPLPGRPALTELNVLRPETGWDEYLEKQGALRAEYSRLFHGESE